MPIKTLVIRLRYKVKPAKARPIIQKFITSHPPVEPIGRSIFYAKYPSDYIHRIQIKMSSELLNKLHAIAAARHVSTALLTSGILEENAPDPEPPPNSELPSPVSSEGTLPSNIVSEEDKPSSRKDSLADLSIEQHAYRHDGTLSGYLGLLAVILQDENTFRESYGRSPLAHSHPRLIWEKEVNYHSLTVKERLQLFFGPDMTLEL